MERLGVVILQLEEAKRFLLMERPEYHRLALILLDNAAELQLHRAMRSSVFHDELMDQIGQRTKGVVRQKAKPLPQELRELCARTPMTEERKARLRRYFGEKLGYLASEKGQVAPDVAEVLRYLHRSRNRAYHDGYLEGFVTRALGVLLLELNCQLLETLPLDMLSWASNEDYSWLGDYGLDSRILLDQEEYTTAITRRLREDMSCTLSSVRDPLVLECERRLARLDDALAFISQSSPAASDRESPLKGAQYMRYVLSGGESWALDGFKRFRPCYGMRFLERCRDRVAVVRGATTPTEAFEEFAHLITDVERIEADVFGLAARIDEYIQFEIDKALGK